MIYLLSQITGWLLFAGLVGAVTGWFTYSEARPQATRWLRWAVLGFFVVLLAVLVRVLPGKLGLWFEELVLFSVVFVLGCLLGGWLKSKARVLPAPTLVSVLPDPDPLAVTSVLDKEAPVAVAPAAVVAATDTAGRPVALPQPPSPDDLTLIRGVGPRNQKICNDLGIFQFGQIATWTPQNADWVGDHLRFSGGIQREQWIEQAKLLGAGLDTEHSSAVRSGTLVIDDHADEPLSEANAESLGAGLPMLAPAVDGESAHAGARPLGLASARGAADDMKLIKGIGKQNEERLNTLGVWHFDQIAAWSSENVKWVGSYLAFPGRIDRKSWITQAAQLAAGRATEFSERVKAGKVVTSSSIPIA